MAFNAAASGWAKRRAPLRRGVRLFEEACASSKRLAPLHPGPAEMGLEGPWALGFSDFGLGLGVSGLILQGFGLRI